MSKPALRYYPLLAMGPVLLWVAALFAPLAVDDSSQFELHLDPHGYTLLLIGWLGFVVISIAWFANIPFVVWVVQMMRRRTPKFGTALSGFTLASTGLLPINVLNLHFGGPALLLWLLSFTVLLGIQVLALPEPRDELAAVRRYFDHCRKFCAARAPQGIVVGWGILQILIISSAVTAVSLCFLIFAFRFLR